MRPNITITPILLLLLLLGVTLCNMYTDPDPDSCEVDTEESCGCGTLKRDPSQKSEDQYDDGIAAQVWDLYMGGTVRTEDYGPTLTHLLHQHNVRTVLDAAAGTGVDSVLLLEAGFTVTSVDLSKDMLDKAREIRSERISEAGFRAWQIGQGDWLDLDNVQDTVTHPDEGYDAVICIGNSFSHLPDDHSKAINNFHKLLKPGGIMVIDHRNFDYILEHGSIPNSSSKLYYQGGDRIHKISTNIHRNCEGVSDRVTLNFEIDISGYPELDTSHETRVKDDGSAIPVSLFSLSYYPHSKDGFTALLKGVFGGEAHYELLPDYRTDNSEDYIPSYFIHVIQKLGEEAGRESKDNSPPTSDNTEGMVLIPEGTFTMGTDNPIILQDAESPARSVSLPDFYIDKNEVTNEQFGAFISATGHVTDAERFGDSFVLNGLLSPEEDAKVENVVQAAPWWLPVKGATWDHPEGRDTDVSTRGHHPVVHVSWNDAKAYCLWAGKRLLTEAEFEKACKGGVHTETLYPWGNDDVPSDGVHRTNIWQGQFPGINTEDDGYLTTSPVGTYPPNQYGVHDLVGNVWEWVEDWWTTQHAPDGTPPKRGQERVKKGGSFMCTKQYCYRYRCPARTKTSADTTGLNVGFRCAKSV